MTIADVPTALYRMLDASGRLLYVGITLQPAARFTRHRETKQWWREIATIDIEWHPDRRTALDAEREAIIGEEPVHNVVHNRGARPAAIITSDRQWTYRLRRGGAERTTALWLYPELDCSACIDDCLSDDGESELLFYIDYLERRYPQWLEADAVPIYWSLEPIGETAPFLDEREDFLTHFTWPTDAATGERLDWFRLPVRNSRFPEFGEALGWLPSPLQGTAPLTSIMQSRRGWAPRNG